MGKKRANWHNVFLFSALLFFQTAAFGQDSLANGIDYSFLRFEDVKSFFDKYDLPLTKAETPDLYFESFCWIGAPYKFGGNSRNGIDCSGFASILYDKIYGKKIEGSSLDIITKCLIVECDSLKEGDLLFFTIKGGVSHVGVYLGNNKFVHATTQGGVMVNDLDELYYKNTFYKVGRLPE
jgi:lipoprotein Spr